MTNPAAFDRCAKDERRLRRALQALGAQLLDEEPVEDGISVLYLGVATTDAVVEEIVPPAVLPTPVDVPYVDVHPCVGLDGSGEDTSVTVRVYMPRMDSKDPTVKEDDVLAYAIGPGGVAVCVTDYLAGTDDDHKVLASAGGDTPDVLDEVLTAGPGITLATALDGNSVEIGHDVQGAEDASETVVVDVEHELGGCEVRVFFKDHNWDEFGHTIGYDNPTDRWSNENPEAAPD